MLRESDIVAPILILVSPISSTLFVVCTVAHNDLMDGCWMLDAKTPHAMLLTALPHTAVILLHARPNAVNRVLYAVCMCTWKSGSGNAFLTARICSYWRWMQQAIVVRSY